MVFRQLCNKERANSENDDQFTRIRPSQLREFEVFLNFIVECEIYVLYCIYTYIKRRPKDAHIKVDGEL